MVAAALPIALVFGVLAELVSGLVARALGGERAWWRRVSIVWPDLLRLWRDRRGRERVAVLEAGGAAAALLGAGLAAAGALGLAPGDLPMIYLSLAVASAGAMVAGSAATEASLGPRWRFRAALAEPAFAVGLGAMFLRYGTLDLEAVRGTQSVLGTGILLAPGLAAAGLIAAALAFSASGALRLSLPAEPGKPGAAPGAGQSLLLRLSRWSLAGATSLVAGVLLAGGGLEPPSLEAIVPVAAGAFGVAAVIGAADALLARVPERWRPATPGVALLLAGAGAAMVVLA